MKHFYIFLILALQASILFSQEFVDTNPQLMNLVLEDYTGIHCSNCPGGHEKADEISKAYPNRAVIIGIHEGYYANPSAGEPDFRTQWGTALLESADVTGFPAGTINRLRFKGTAGSSPYYIQQAGGRALSISGWKKASEDSVFNGSFSPVNIATKTNWNNDSRELSIEVELYFVKEIPNNVKLNIFFLESHIWGPQTGAANPKNYEHNHVLRDVLTSQWGEEITNTQLGNCIKKTYKYHVSEIYKILNCDLAVFVTDNSDNHIITGINHKAIPPNCILKNNNDYIVSTLSNSTKNISFNLKNISEKSTHFLVDITKSNRTPNDWEASIKNDMNNIILNPEESALIDIDITTGNSKGVGDFYITVSEADNPIFTPVYDSLFVVTSDINYLEIDCGGSILNDMRKLKPEAVSLSYTTYQKVSSKLQNPSIIVWNTGAKGRINNSDATIIDSLIQSGTELFINGSAGIPMLTIDNPGHNLFNTLAVTWSQFDEITLKNFSLIGVENDPVTKDFHAPNLSVTNNGYNMQPMTITDNTKTFPMIKMEDNGKTISIRTISQTSRTIYLSFNLDIIEDSGIKNDLLLKSFNWLEGISEVNETNLSYYPLNIFITKNCSDCETYLNINNNNHSISNIKIQLVNILGESISQIYSGVLDYGNSVYQINTTNLPNGLYFIIVNTESGIFVNKMIK